MAWGGNTNPVAIGAATRKVDYDDLWDKLQYIRTDVIPAASIMLFGQIAVQGWTRKADWQDDCALIYSASGALGSGGSVAASVHTHSVPNHQHYLDTYTISQRQLNTEIVALQAGTMRSMSAYVDQDGGTTGVREYTATDGNTTTGTSTAYYQEVAAFTKDTYT